MTEEILIFLKQNDLSIMNLRGQGYDNGANMRGKKTVFSLILQISIQGLSSLHVSATP